MTQIVKIDPKVFAHLAESEASTGKQENYCACGKTPGRCSLGVKRQGPYLLYNCFSNGCPVKGGKVVMDATSVGEYVEAEKDNRPKIDFSDAKPRLPDYYKQWLRQYGIGRATCAKYGITYSKSHGRLVFPVRGLFGDVLAYTARDITKGAHLKWLHDRTLQDVCYTSSTNAVYCHRQSRIGIIVEDPISCVVAGQLTPTLALLGTNYKIKYKAIRDWIEFNNIEKIVVCLDRDAYDKCHTLSQFLLDKGVLAVTRLVDKDLKECTDKEIIELIKGN